MIANQRSSYYQQLSFQACAFLLKHLIFLLKYSTTLNHSTLVCNTVFYMSEGCNTSSIYTPTLKMFP